MWIKSITLRNFRSFGDNPQSLVAKPHLNVIVGENNSGKSSIFAGVEALLNGGPIQAKQLPWGSAVNETSLLMTVDLGDHLHLLTHQAIDPALRELEASNWSVQDALRQRLYDIFAGDTVLALRGNQERYSASTMVGEFDASRSALASVLQPMTLANAIRRISKPEEVLSHINGPEVHVGFPIVIEGAVRDLLRIRYRKFADVRPKPIPHTGNERIKINESFDGQGTGDLLFNLKNGDGSMRKKYERIQREFIGFFPSTWFDVGHDVNGGRGVPEIVFGHRGNEEFDVPSTQVGSGVFEVLTILANLHGRVNHILVIEEPELHLHPQAQRALNTSLLQCARQNQIFVITHSPEFLRCDDLGALSRVTIRDGASSILQAPPKLTENETAALIEALKDSRNREMLFARAVALVEGETERNYFAALAPRLRTPLDNLGISIISVDGEMNYKPFIKFLKAFSIPVRCLRDKAPAGVTPEWHDLFDFVGMEFEEYMEAQGFGQLLAEAREKVGRAKPRVGRYVGEHIPIDKVPKVHVQFLGTIARLVEREE